MGGAGVGNGLDHSNDNTSRVRVIRIPWEELELVEADAAVAEADAVAAASQKAAEEARALADANPGDPELAAPLAPGQGERREGEPAIQPGFCGRRSDVGTRRVAASWSVGLQEEKRSGLFVACIAKHPDRTQLVLCIVL